MAEQAFQIKTDILVIGGGAAAAMAAMAAAKTGLEVLLVDKGRFGRSGSTFCAGGTASYWSGAGDETEPGDSAELFLEDMINGGEGLANPAMAGMLVTEAGPRCRELMRLGLDYQRDQAGNPQRRRILGYRFARPALHPVGVRTMGGVALMDWFRREVLARGVKVREHLMITNLLTDSRRVVGAVGLDTWTGERVIFQAAAVVLAAGSAVDLFTYNSNFAGPRKRYGATGDAYALLDEVGAAMVNLEFLEFTVIPTPAGRAIPVGGTKPTTAAGARWYNRLGERIMERYDPERLELTTRNMMVLANFLEREAGRGPVMMDLSFTSAAQYDHLVKRSHPVPRLIAAGLDPRRERIEWAPALHTFLGGALVDSWGHTTVPGLLAAGEAAGHGGAFGADRTGTAIAACFVLGHRAGQEAARWAQVGQGEFTGITREQIKAKLAWLDSLGLGQLPPAELKKQIRQVADRHLHVMREGAGLAGAVADFQALRQAVQQLDGQKGGELAAAVECHNLARTGELVAWAALAREETRGQHHRRDFPDQEQSWQCWLKLQGGEVTTIQVPPSASYKRS